MSNRLSLLPANLDSRINVKDALTFIGVLSLINQLLDLVILLEFDIAVQQKGRIVLIVISHCVQIHIRLDLRRLDESFQVLDQIGQVLHFYEPLNDIGRIQIANCLDVLLQSFFRLSLVQVISVFFTDFCMNISREVGS